MGYSGRYHAASLIAVFAALAIGILVGVGLGSDVVSGTAADLEADLQQEVERAGEEASQARAELERQQEFAEAVYPALVGDRLVGERVSIVGVGGLPEDVSMEVRDLLAPTGAELGQIAVARVPPDVGSLVEAVDGVRARAALADPEAQERLGEVIVRAARGAGDSALRSAALERFSGSAERPDAVVVVRDVASSPAQAPGADEGALDEDALREAEIAIEAAIISALGGLGVPAVGVTVGGESGEDVDAFVEAGLTSVDNIEEVAGKVATVFALLGAEGSFGAGGGADRLLPDILAPGEPTGPAAGAGPGGG